MKNVIVSLTLFIILCNIITCKRKAPYSTQSDQYTKSLINACAKGDLQTVKRLAAAGANLNAKIGEGHTPDAIPLVVAAQHGNDNIFDFLILSGASTEGWAGESILRYAAANGRIKIVKYLLSSGVSVNIGTKEFTPLMEAARYNQTEIIKLLLSHGAIIDDCDTSNLGDRHTALMLAAENRHSDTIKILIENKANTNAIIVYGENCSGPFSGWTPLMLSFNENHYAYSESEHIKCIDYLLAAGANPNHIDKCGCTSLDYAKRNDFPVAEKHLVEKGGKLGENCQLPPEEMPDNHGK